MEIMQKKKTSIVINNELWTRFKIECVKRGRNLSDVLEELLHEYLSKKSG